jgi:hypothetical protein
MEGIVSDNYKYRDVRMEAIRERAVELEWALGKSARDEAAISGVCAECGARLKGEKRIYVLDDESDDRT